MSRILIHEPRPGSNGGPALPRTKGEDVVVCRDREALVNAMACGRPDVLVYVLKHPTQDLELLGQIRRIAPSLAIIVLGDTTDLAFRRAIQELKPIYYGLLPIDAAELGEAVDGALHRGSSPS